MSFISLVSAGKGFAIIADSLEMLEIPLPEIPIFMDDTYILNCTDSEGDIFSLLNRWLSSPLERSETERWFREDHADKLFPMDQFSAIAATRSVTVNDKCLQELIGEFKVIWQETDNADEGFDAKRSGFCDFLNREIKIHLKNYCHLKGSVLIMAEYDALTMKTHTCKIRIRDIYHHCPHPTDNFLVQGHIPSTIIFGGYSHICKPFLQGFEKIFVRDVYTLVRNIVRRIHSSDNRLPGEFIHALIHDRFYKYLFSHDLKNIDIHNLSIQQAIDLASLLLRLEMDYYTFTKAESKVGGVISLAVVDEEGFRFIR